MYGSSAVTLLVLISDDVINRILKLDIKTNILVYVTRCCTDLTSKVLKERTFGQSSALLFRFRLINALSRRLFKGVYLSKALTCMKIFLYKQELLLMSRRRIPLVTLVFEQLIHLTKITLRPNIQLLSNPQHAYQSF